MTGAILFLALGGWFVYSALKGQSLADALTGTGDPLSPAGGKGVPVAAGSTISGTGSVGANNLSTESVLVAEMNRMIGLHQPYRWGGGHGAKPDPNGPWDCSGAVSQVTDVVGLLPHSRPMTSTGFMTWGEAGRGDLYTIYANPTHVFIHMEAGQYAGQDWGTTSRLPSEGGSLKWQQHTKVGFTARRPIAKSGPANP